MSVYHNCSDDIQSTGRLSDYVPVPQLLIVNESESSRKTTEWNRLLRIRVKKKKKSAKSNTKVKNKQTVKQLC